MQATSLLLWTSGLLFAQHEGIRAFNEGRYSEAVRILSSQASRDDHDALFLALARAATGECSKVSSELDALARGVKDRELGRLAGVGLAQCFLSRGDSDAALSTLARLKVEFPADPDVLYLIAKLHLRLWNSTVEQMYRTAPSSWRVNQLSAEIFEIQSKYPEAIAEYRKAIEKNPAAVNLHYRLGRALLLQSHAGKNLALARAEFEAELKLNPSDSVAEYQIAQILLAEQKPQDAAARLERAVAINPDFVEALVALGRIRKDPSLLERAIVLQPRNEAARYALMMAYRNAGRTDEAKTQQAEIEKLQKPPEGEFTEFLKRIGEKPQK